MTRFLLFFDPLFVAAFLLLAWGNARAGEVLPFLGCGLAAMIFALSWHRGVGRLLEVERSHGEVLGMERARRILQ